MSISRRTALATGAAAITTVSTAPLAMAALAAIGSYEDDGDEALEVYQDWGKPWMAAVAADFERLSRGAPS